ncbi:MAG: TetR/AcrR family transcriptional regulator [Pseudomonadales bacterium]
MPSAKPKKRDITRKRVIDATVDCIYRDGFNAAHTNKIAEEAGVTWGVLQYHFGDKDGLLQATLDSIFEDFKHTLQAADVDAADLQHRISNFVDVIWTLVSKKQYRVSTAILRNAGKDKTSRINGQKQAKLWSAIIGQLWNELLQGEKINAATKETSMRLLFATIRGLHDDVNPHARLSRNSYAAERAALVQAIHYLLTRPTEQ